MPPSLCWKCSKPQGFRESPCPHCGATNPNVDLPKAVGECDAGSVSRAQAADQRAVPSPALLRQWAADQTNEQCWGLAEVANELERLRRENTAAPEMKTVLDDLEESFDKQIYPEQVKEDFDAPDDREYTVTITAKRWRALSRALSKAEGRSVTAAKRTEDPVIVIGCDLGLKDMSALVVALQKAGRLEYFELCQGTGPEIERELELLRAQLPEAPRLSPPSLPYWRRFERKRWAR